MPITSVFSVAGKNHLTTGKHSLKLFFSRKDVSLACMVLAIGTKILLALYFTQLDTDKLFQAMAGKNFAEGHGLTIKQVHVNDLSKEYYEQLQGWPPGYSIVAGLIYLLVHDVDTACIIIDVILIVLFFTALKKLLKQLDFPAYLVNLLLLFKAASMPFSLTTSTPTDFLTFVLYLYLCSFVIGLFQGARTNFNKTALAVINILPAWFKYMYLPVTFVIPLFIIWNGWKQKDRQLYRYGVITCILAVLGTAALLAIQLPYSKPADYVAVSEKGIFLSNIGRLYPFYISAFVTLDFYLVQLSMFTKYSYVAWLTVLKWMNLVLFLPTLAWFLWYAFKKKWLTTSGWNTFILAGGSLCLTLLSGLVGMAVTHNKNFAPPRLLVWTYLDEERYLMLPEFFVFVITVRLLFLQHVMAYRLKRWLQGAFVLIVAIETGHCAYFLVKNFTFDQRHFAVATSQKRMLDYIQHLVQQNKQKGVNVVVTNSTLANRSVLMGGKGLVEVSELNRPQIHASQPTMLVAVMNDYEFAYYKPFLSKPGVRLINTMNNRYVYACWVMPENQH
jgi:hypothetical protein